MRYAAVFLALTIVAGAAGCTASSPPPSEPSPATESPSSAEPIKADPADEADYIEKMAAAFPPGGDSQEARQVALDLGYMYCEAARDRGVTTADAAQTHIDGMDQESDEYPMLMGLSVLAGGYSGELLCPDYAE